MFSYSERPNTHAATIADTVNPAVRTRRSDALRALSMRKKQDFYRVYVGKCVDVLIEESIDDGMMEGFTGNYIRVKIPANPLYGNHILPVRLTSYDPESEVCHGEVAAV